MVKNNTLLDYKNRYNKNKNESLDFEVLNTTALSKVELNEIKFFYEILDKLNLPKEDFVFIGNVAVALQLEKKQSKIMNSSHDLDILYIGDKDLTQILKDRGNLNIKIRQSYPIRMHHEGLSLDKVILEESFEKFYFYTVSINKKEKGINLDVFTTNTGIGYIPLDKEDKNLILNKGGINYIDLGLLIVTMMNPYTFNPEKDVRVKRVCYLLKKYYNKNNGRNKIVYKKELSSLNIRIKKKLSEMYEEALKNLRHDKAELKYLLNKSEKLVNYLKNLPSESSNNVMSYLNLIKDSYIEVIEEYNKKIEYLVKNKKEK